MRGPQVDLLALDASTGEITWRCAGPDSDGACPRIAIGETVPCVGHLLLSLPGPYLHAAPYVVPGCMTLCPITLALALDAETPLLPRGAPAPGPGWRAPPMPVAA